MVERNSDLQGNAINENVPSSSKIKLDFCRTNERKFHINHKKNGLCKSSSNGYVNQENSQPKFIKSSCCDQLTVPVSIDKSNNTADDINVLSIENRKEESICYCNSNNKYSKTASKTVHCPVSSESIITSMEIQGIKNNIIFTRKHVKLKSFATLKSMNGNCSKNPKYSSVTNDHVIHNQNLKASSLENTQLVYKNNSPYTTSELKYVYNSLQRLSYIYEKFSSFEVNHSGECDDNLFNKLLMQQDSNTNIEIIKFRNLKSPKKCLPKSMRSLCMNNGTTSKKRLKSNSSDDGIHIKKNELYFKCNWHDCKHQYRAAEKLTKHVKKEHLMLVSKNEVFVCLWKDCKFAYQESCSYKWLSRHVLSHCDVKPFKCVIHGCDMGFVTQSGLARHVPTHFNERNVRRACVLTSNYELNKKNTHFITQGIEAEKIQDINTPTSCQSSNGSTEDLTDSVVTQLNHSIPTVTYSQKLFKHIQKKLQQNSCNAIVNYGFTGNKFRIDHKVIGKRTTADGVCDVLLAPTTDKLFPNRKFWFDEESFRKRKTSHIDVQCSNIPTETKSILYDNEHVSSRRKKKRK